MWASLEIPFCFLFRGEMTRKRMEMMLFIGRIGFVFRRGVVAVVVLRFPLIDWLFRAGVRVFSLFRTHKWRQWNDQKKNSENEPKQKKKKDRNRKWCGVVVSTRHLSSAFDGMKKNGPFLFFYFIFWKEKRNTNRPNGRKRKNKTGKPGTFGFKPVRSPRAIGRLPSNGSFRRKLGKN